MFPARYFAPRYFAPHYFAEEGNSVDPGTGIHVLINEGAGFVDRTPYLRVESPMSWNLLRTSSGQASIPLIFSPTDTYTPQLHWDVEIYETDATRVWVGEILSWEIQWIADFGWRQITLSCTTYDRSITGNQLSGDTSTTPTAAGTILTNNFAAVGTPVTVGTIDTGATIPSLKLSGNFQSLSNKMAMDSGYVWFIDPQTKTYNFLHPTSYPAPFTVDNTEGTILWDTLRWKLDATDSRDKVVIQTSQKNMPATVEAFEGDGSTTTFSLADVPTNITSAVITGGTQATVTGTFTATNANDGDTFTINGLAYTFRTAIDNAEVREVLIGATSQATTQNMVDAINAEPSTIGTSYSNPTSANPDVLADQPTGSPARTFVMRARAFGTSGNSITSTESTTGFSWSGSTLSGGTDAPPAGQYSINVGIGSTGVSVVPPMPSGTNAVISYYSTTTPALTVGDGDTARRTTLDDSPNIAGTLFQGQAILTAFNQQPATVNFDSYRPGLFPGMYTAISITNPVTAGAVLNGNWIVQEVQARWVPGLDTLVGNPTFAHFHYTYELINNLEVAPFTNFWDNLASVGGTDSMAPPDTPTTEEPPPLLPYLARLLIKDSTVGDDIADHINILTPFTGDSPSVSQVQRLVRMTALLRITISSIYVVRINNITTADSWVFDIPAATAVDTVLTSFITGDFHDGDILTADILASDGQTDAAGIATITLEWV